MASSSDRNIYFSFFMFTADLRPDDREYTKEIVRHMQALRRLDIPVSIFRSLPPIHWITKARSRATRD